MQSRCTVLRIVFRSRIREGIARVSHNNLKYFPLARYSSVVFRIYTSMKLDKLILFCKEHNFSLPLSRVFDIFTNLFLNRYRYKKFVSISTRIILVNASRFSYTWLFDYRERVTRYSSADALRALHYELPLRRCVLSR